MTQAASPGRPGWVDALRGVLATARAEQLSRFLPPPGHHRRSAVLILFAGDPARPGPDGLDVLLTERAASLRSHAGQVSFPGGAIDAGDDGPGAAAVREAVEETGLDAAGVDVLGVLPEVYLPVSDFAVAPVVAHWREPSAVGVVDPGEVAVVARVAVADLVDPANRCSVTHPSGWVGPGFTAGGLFVWGFTAGLLDRVLHLAGWERPWDAARRLPYDTGARARAGGGLEPAAGPAEGLPEDLDEVHAEDLDEDVVEGTSVDAPDAGTAGVGGRVERR